MENSQKTTVSTFGSFSMSKEGGNLFGSATKLFGSSASSQFGMVSESKNIFSQGSSLVFGTASKPTSSTKPGSGLFGSGSESAQGQSQQLSSANAISTTATTFSIANTRGEQKIPSVFGSVPITVDQKKPTVFGSVSTSSSGTGFGNTFASPSSGTLFGKSTNTSTAPALFSSSESVFGAFGKKGETANFGLFTGSANQATTSSNTLPQKNTTDSGTVFGGQLKKKNTTSSTFSNVPNQPDFLFGKPQPPALCTPSSSSFHIQKDKTTPLLFGKPVSTAQTTLSTVPVSLPSTSFISQSASFHGQQRGESSIGSVNKPSGLFGKPPALFTENKSKVTDEDDGTESGDVEEFKDHDALDPNATSKKSIGRWKSTRKPAAMPLVRRRSLLASSSKSTPDVLSEDAAPSRSLMICNIPPDYCDKETLREHFSQYGNIILIRVTPDKCSASITFDTKETALKAKEATTIDSESPPMDIFYRQSPQNMTAKRTISKILREPRKKNLSQDAENELKSMAEIPEFETDPFTSSKPSSPKPKRSIMTRQHSPTPPRRSSPTPQPAISVPQDAAEAQAPPDINTVKGLLKALYQAKATETNERIAILDKRDQLLKLLRGRQQSDLASAKAFKGTCPDMCPEKERYYREDTRRLALFEVILSTMSTVAGQKTKVDHAKAVKEYSRSSADQVEPLPHELRPLSVLQSTMVYLLKYVADEGAEGKWSEWYDFLWNRTRGIRKDITQQQLCHVNVAQLLEHCARFHIFCSERLCEEDMMTFDAKINNENLTKCLQTLKELYSDLESKHSYHCPNEAEIRAYIVLMNLNQGDTLWEIQQLRPEIRDSTSIRFAVQAYNALNSSNYVRFFRLIKKTTFLNGCILHRYFNQIRTKALLIIKKAMATQGKSMSYPVSEMIRLMCFENASEVVEFSSHYGLRVENNDIILDGTSFLQPEGSLPQRRSTTLVESKRNVSVGEIIFGGPLPELDLPQPFSSFDGNGHFVFSSEFQQVLTTSGLKITSHVGEMLSRGPGMPAAPPSVPPVMNETTVVVPDSSKLPLARDVTRIPYSNEAIKSAARVLILEETDGQAVSIVHEVLETERVKEISCETVSSEMVLSALEENIRSLVNDVIEEEEQELRQALELESKKQQCMERLCEDLLSEVMGSLAKDLAKEEWKIAEEECARKTLDRCAQSCTDTILDLVVREQIDDVASEVYQVDVVIKRERLAATEARILSERMRQCFHHWQRSYLKRVRVKRAMLDFPVAPPSRSQSAQLSALVPSRPSNRIIGNSFYVGERAKLSVASPMDTLYNNLHLSAKLSMASAQQMLTGLLMWQPLDIGSTVSLQLINLLQEWKDCNSVDKDTKYIQWKIALSTPVQKSDEETDFVRWVKTKLGWEMPEDASDQKLMTTIEGEVISKYTTALMVPQSPPLSLSFCVRSFHGNWKDDQATTAAKLDVLKGMSGLVFITSDADTFVSDKTQWKKDRVRLQDMLTKKQKFPAVPVVIIIPRLTTDVAVSTDLLSDNLQLTNLHKKGLLSAVHFAQPCISLDHYGMDFGSEWTTQLCNCIRFLATHIPTPPSLAIKPLADYVEDGVVEFYKATVYQDLRTRTRHQLLHQSPNTLLSLYNDVIDHLAMVIASDSLTKCSWPAPEFDHQSIGLKSDWNSQEHLCDIYELMTKMRLPFFHYCDMEIHSWEDACQDVWKYIEAVTKKDSGSAKICLYQKVIDVLHTSKKRFDQFCWLASEDGDCEPTYVNMSWTDLVDACIHYKMVSLRTGHLHFSKADEDEPKEDDFEEIIVYYDQSEMEDYGVPSSWLEALRDTETVASLHIKQTINKRSGLKRSRDEGESHNENAKKCNYYEIEPQNNNEESIRSTETADPVLKNLSESYFEMLDSEKEASERYEKILASVLDNSKLMNESLTFSTPFFQHSLREQSHQREFVSDSTPNSKRSGNTEVRPDLKRRKLSELLSRSGEKFSLQANLDESNEEIVGSKLKEKHSPIFQSDSDTITKKMMDLKEEVERQKRLDTLYEMKLKKWMTDATATI